MNEARTVLFELGTEELPPRALESLRTSLASGVAAELRNAGLSFDQNVKAYASARRLAVQVPGVATQTTGSTEIRKGPSVQAAFDAEGNPTRALLGFAKGCRAGPGQIERWASGEDCLKTGKGEWVRFERQVEPLDCRDLLPDLFSRTLKGLPLTKRMRWGVDERSFLRPVRWVVLMYGSEAIAGKIMGLPCEAITRGHRFLGEKRIALPDATAYVTALEERGHVLVMEEVRRQRILEQVGRFETEHKVAAIYSGALLDEVCAGTEFPVVVSGRFDEEFLSLPEEVVRAVLEDQRHFPARAPEGGLSPYFVAVANLPDVRGKIRAGCERVVHSRLQDAAFYLERDQGRSLAARVDDLERVVYHHGLGSLLDRARRIEQLAAHVARKVMADEGIVRRAASLCKADLGTDIVQSLPELQGVMGGYYARAGNEEPEVCRAVAEHYRPRHADDTLPESLPGQVLALADRLDMLAGVFLIGEVPTGTRDPLGVRRAAYGILRLCVECELDLDLGDCLARAVEAYPSALRRDGASQETLDYLADRMRGYGTERGQSKDTVEAVLAVESTHPLDAFRRIREVEAFRHRPQAKVLVATHKRTRNILREVAGVDGDIETALLVESAERSLAEKLGSARGEVLEHCAAGRYGEALHALAELAEPVSVFFDEVLVMAEDSETRSNRLRLLKKLQDLFLKIADFSRLQG